MESVLTNAIVTAMATISNWEYVYTDLESFKWHLWCNESSADSKPQTHLNFSHVVVCSEFEECVSGQLEAAPCFVLEHCVPLSVNQMGWLCSVLTPSANSLCIRQVLISREKESLFLSFLCSSRGELCCCVSADMGLCCSLWFFHVCTTCVMIICLPSSPVPFLNFSHLDSVLDWYFMGL